MTSNNDNTAAHPDPHNANGHILDHIAQVANVVLYDESHGVFGELLDPTLVLQGMSGNHHVGRMDDPAIARASQAVHSFLCTQDTREVGIEFENLTSRQVAVRWLDERGLCFPQSCFSLEPQKSEMRYSRLGHLFVLTLLGEEEKLLGAYRIRMHLPSGFAHYVTVEEMDHDKYHLEAILADPSGADERIVVGAALDPVEAGPQALALSRTIRTLSTIVDNLVQNPDDPKFQSLRLSNPAVQNALQSGWAAQQLLRDIGFREDQDNDRLVLDHDNDNDEDNPTSQRRIHFRQLLRQLQERSRPGFVAELAPTPPWKGPVLNSALSHGRSTFGTGDTHFLSDDEKWERAERNQGRRARAGRRPNPGNAPSSRGNWGR